jgi:hypothetical protein
MKDEHPHQEQLSTEERLLIQQLRERPGLMERFKHILEIAFNADGPIKTADEVEALLIEEMRRLGNVTMQGWGEQVERKLAEQLKQKNVSAVVRKKNADMVVCVWGGECCGTDLANQGREVFAFVARNDWSQVARTFKAIGACVNRFWERAFLQARGGAGAGALRF